MGRASRPDERPGGTVTQSGEPPERYLEAILHVLKRGARKAMSIPKPSEAIQRESKSPSEFFERLCKACRLYTPKDLEAAGSQMVINAAFVSLAYPENVRWGDTK